MTTKQMGNQTATRQPGIDEASGNGPKYSGDDQEPLGRRLQSARAAQGWSLEEVAAAIRIKASTLKALEENHLHTLPAANFVRGFVRVYAAHLGLDPKDALRLHLKEQGLPNSVVTETIDIRETITTGNMAEIPRSLTVIRVFGLLLLLVMLIFFAYWAYTNHFRPPTPPVVPPVALLSDRNYSGVPHLVPFWPS